MSTNSKLLSREFIKSHSIDAAQVLESTDEHAVCQFLAELPAALAATVLTVMDITTATRCFNRLDTECSSKILSQMTVDASDRVMRRLDEGKRAIILGLFPADKRFTHEVRLRYPSASAGSLMDPHAPSLPHDILVEDALQRLQKLPEGLVYHVYVVNRDSQLIGLVTLRQLMTALPQHTVASVMQKAAGVLHPEMSRDAILAHPAWKVYPILPVVDTKSVFLGAITYRTLRLLEEAGGKQNERESDASAALGELYWMGMIALFKGAVTALKTETNE